jgi:nitrate reductase NapAB chaperone NapD
MVIAGVVILADTQRITQVLNQLNEVDSVTTYGVYKDNHIVAVFEGDTPEHLENISDRITNNIPGVLGVFPAYVRSDEEIEESN